jgi:hemerythrin-like domain-containing protein
VTASRNHFDKEERIVFPLAERILKIRTLTELGSQWLKQRDKKSAKPRFNDSFLRGRISWREPSFAI